MHNIPTASIKRPSFAIERPSFGVGDRPWVEGVFRQVRAQCGARHLGTEEIVDAIFTDLVAYCPTALGLRPGQHSGNRSFRLRDAPLDRFLRRRGEPCEIELPARPDANRCQSSYQWGVSRRWGIP